MIDSLCVDPPSQDFHLLTSAERQCIRRAAIYNMGRKVMRSGIGELGWSGKFYPLSICIYSLTAKTYASSKDLREKKLQDGHEVPIKGKV